MELPMNPSGPTDINPNKLILFSSPKAGKSEALSRLENNLILDLEEGSGYVTGLKIDVIKEAKEKGIKPIAALKGIMNQIRDANEKKGSFVYKYISIDTISALQDKFAPELALKMYLNTSQGRNFQSDNILDLGNGYGWAWLRDAILLIIEELEGLCETLIISAHTKDKVIEFQGEEMTQRGIDLAGKTPAIICSKSDAIAYLYRKDNKTIANFQTAETLSVGARPEHLKNKEIVLLESDEAGVISSHWDRIFLK